MSNEAGNNKLDLITIVLRSHLAPEDKTLLIELLMRSDKDWYSWPSVQRLCQARGIKFEKNFKGADKYLPDLVQVTRRGRKNTYTLDPDAIAALPQAAVVIKHTPALAANAPAVGGEDDPAVAENAPDVAENNPSEGGANSTKNITEDSTRDSSKETTEVAAGASTLGCLEEDVSLILPLASLTGDPSSCGEYTKSDKPRGSASGLEDKGHLVPSRSSIWDEEW